jgi:energy-coupling factor transporter ATP-binding protein EcfA2
MSVIAQRMKETNTQKRIQKRGFPVKARKRLPPAYFLEIELENLRCFGPKQRLDVSDGQGRPSQWTVILGDNGVGKTTILQAIASFAPVYLNLPEEDGTHFEYAVPKFSLRSNRLGWQPFRSNGENNKLSISAKIYSGSKLKDQADGNIDRYAFKTLELGRSSYTLIPFARIGGLQCHGYGATRRMGSTSLSDNDEYDDNISLFRDDVALLNAEEWLLQADYAASKRSRVQKQAKKRRDQVKTVLIDLLPDVDDIKFVQPNEHPTPSVRFKTPYGWVSVQDLSLGYKTLTAWMVDLASRMFDQYPKSPNPLAEPAVVLIDEIDLHLHPKWQRTLMNFLSERFINTQFIVTAHSPLVVQAAVNAKIVLLRRQDDHVIIDNNVEAIQGWRVD